MVDHNADAAKQIDTMTDKVQEREIAGTGNAVQNLQSEATEETLYLIPEKKDIELLQNQFGVGRFQIIDSFTKAEGDFENTVRDLLRTF